MDLDYIWIFMFLSVFLGISGFLIGIPVVLIISIFGKGKYWSKVKKGTMQIMKFYARLFDAI